MTSDSEYTKHGVEQPFGAVNIKEIPLKTKPENGGFSTSQIEIDIDTLKSELAEKELLPVFEDQTLEEVGAEITGAVPTMCFYSLGLYQHGKTAINKHHLHLARKAR